MEKLKLPELPKLTLAELTLPMPGATKTTPKTETIDSAALPWQTMPSVQLVQDNQKYLLPDEEETKGAITYNAVKSALEGGDRLAALYTQEEAWDGLNDYWKSGINQLWGSAEQRRMPYGDKGYRAGLAPVEKYFSEENLLAGKKEVRSAEDVQAELDTVQEDKRRADEYFHHLSQTGEEAENVLPYLADIEKRYGVKFRNETGAINREDMQAAIDKREKELLQELQDVKAAPNEWGQEYYSLGIKFANASRDADLIMFEYVRTLQAANKAAAERKTTAQALYGNYKTLLQRYEENPTEENKTAVNAAGAHYNDFMKVCSTAERSESETLAEILQRIRDNYSTAADLYEESEAEKHRWAEDRSVQAVKMRGELKAVNDILEKYNTASPAELENWDAPMSYDEAIAEQKRLERELEQVQRTARRLLPDERNSGWLEHYEGMLGAEDFAKYAKQGAGATDWVRKHANIGKEEQDLYYYLYGKYGKGKAEHYYSLIEERLNQRTAKERLEKNANQNVPMEMLGGFATSVAAGVDNFGQGIASVFSDKDRPATVNQLTTAQWVEQGGRTEKFVSDVGGSVGNMLPAVVSTIGLSAAGMPQAGAAAFSAGLTGLSAGGAAKQQALQEGYTAEQARAYGALVGASEACLQYLLGGVSAMGGVADDVLLAKVAQIDSAFARLVLTGAIKLGSEITEEELQLWLEPMFRTLVAGDTYKAPTWDEMWETAIVTAITTGIMEGGNIIGAAKTGNARYAEIGRRMKMIGGYEEAVLETALHLPKETAAYELAMEIQTGQKQTDASTMGELYSLAIEGGADPEAVAKTALHRFIENETAKAGMGAAENETAVPEGTTEQYGIRVFPDGKKYVNADRQVIFGNDPDSWSEQLENYINGKIRGGENVQLIAEDGDVLTLTADTAGKISDNHTSDGRTLNDDYFYLKANAGAHIDELAQVSKRGEGDSDDHGGRHGETAKDGWNYRTAYFRDFDGKYYRVTISVQMGSDGNAVYNIGRIKERSFPNVRSSSAQGGAQGGKTSSTNSIPASPEKSNPQDLTEVPGLYGYAGVEPGRWADFRTAEQIAKRFGAKLQVSELANSAEGSYGAGVITISPHSADPVTEVLVHELTHHMERSGLYGEFASAVLDYAENEMGADLEAMRQEVTRQYAAKGAALTEEGANRELVAKFAQEYLFKDETAIRRLVQTKPKLGERILNWIREKLHLFEGEPQEAFIRKAETMYKAALEDAARRPGESEAEAEYLFADDGDLVESADIDPRTLTTEDAINLIERANQGEFPLRNYIPVRSVTPNVLIETAVKNGLPSVAERPLAANVEHVQQSMDPDVAANDGKRGHALTSDQIAEIVENMDAPQKIYYQQDNGRYVMIVKFDNNGKTEKAMVIVDTEDRTIGKKYLNGYSSGYYNILVTTFTPDNKYYKKYVANENNVLVYDEMKDAPQSGSGSLVPSHLNGTSFINSIRNSFEKNNPQNAESQNAIGSLFSELAERAREKRAQRDARPADYDELFLDETENDGRDPVYGESSESLRQAADARPWTLEQELEELAAERGAQMELDTEEEQSRARDLTEYFESVQELRDRKMPAKPEGDGSELISTKTKKDRKSLREGIADSWGYLVRKMVDSGNAVTKVGKLTKDPYLYYYYNMARASSGAATSIITDAMTDIAGRNVGKSLNEILNPIRKKGEEYYNRFQLFLFHRHNVDRMSRRSESAIAEAEEAFAEFKRQVPELNIYTEYDIERMAMDEMSAFYFEACEYMRLRDAVIKAKNTHNAPVFGEQYTAEHSRELVDRLLSENPEFAELAEDVYSYIDNLMQYRVDSGLITEVDRARLKQIYPHYVPTFRVMEKKQGAKTKGRVQVGSTIGRAVGGDQKIMPLHQALASQTLNVVREGSKNRFGRRLMNGGAKSTKYVLDVKEAEDTFHENTFDDPDAQKDERTNVFIVREGGKRYVLEVSPELFEAVKALSPEPEESNTATKAVRKVNDVYKRLITGWSPKFMVTNFVKDLQDAVFYSKDLWAFAREYPKAWKEIASNGEYWKRYKALGGTYTTVFDYNTGETGKTGKLEVLNQFVEQVPRLTEFMATVKKHGGLNANMNTLMEAMHNAADITVNFGRSGTFGKVLNASYIPFLNPGIQGFDKMIRSVTETKGVRQWFALIGKAALLGFAPTMINELLNGDDEEWEDIRQSDKDVNYLFKLKDGLWLKIPKGRTLSLLGMVGDRGKNLLTGQDVDWGGFIRTAAAQTAPANPLSESILTAWFDADLLNKDSTGRTWYGGVIENQRLQGYEPSLRYDAKTDVLSKWIGKKLDLSPKKINYLLDQYTGVVGDVLLPLMTPTAERDMFSAAFTVDSVASNRLSSDFYDRLDELAFAKNNTDASGEDKVLYRFWNKQASAIGEVNAAIRRIEEDASISNKEKKDLLQAQYAIRNGIIRNAEKCLPAYEAAAAKHYDEAVGEPDEREDYAYLMANWDVLGAEFAWRTYNKATYEKKAVALEQEGVSYDDSLKIYLGIRNAADLEGAEAYCGKRNVIRESGLDEEGKVLVYSTFISDTKDDEITLFRDAGLSVDDFLTFENAVYGLASDETSTKKEKVVAKIDEMEVTPQQKDAMYLAAGYAESTLDDAPWNSTARKLALPTPGKTTSVLPKLKLPSLKDLQLPLPKNMR